MEYDFSAWEAIFVDSKGLYKFRLRVNTDIPDGYGQPDYVERYKEAVASGTAPKPIEIESVYS